jgi:hypothetical protein
MDCLGNDSNTTLFLVIISTPRMRWGLSTFRVLYAVILENIAIMDHEVSEGHHDLYLLDGAHGETIAAPLTLRITTSKTPKTDVTILCLTTVEAFEWRKHITTAKSARDDILETYTRVGSFDCFRITDLTSLNM